MWSTQFGQGSGSFDLYINFGLTRTYTRGKRSILNMVFVRDPFGIICLMASYGCIFYADYVVIRWIILITMPLSAWAPFHIVLFNTIVFLLGLAHSKAAFSDPGIVPLSANRLDFSDGNQWTLCSRCETYKPPRAYHCSICKRCIRGMDHHCPWINNCVGEFNRKYFIQCLFYGGILSLYCAALILVAWLSPCTNCKQIVSQTQTMHIFILMTESALFAIFLSAIMVDQLSVIWYDEMVFDAAGRRKRRKYELLAEVFGRGHPILWLLPCDSLNHRTRYHNTTMLSHDV